MKRYDGLIRYARENGLCWTSLLGWPALPTHRQYRTWTEWEINEWNRPSRSDYYIMQLTIEVRRIVGWMNNNPGPLTLEKMKISFKTYDEENSSSNLEEISQRAMAVWRARLRINEDGSPKGEPKVLKTPPVKKNREAKR